MTDTSVKPVAKDWHVYIVRCADGSFYTGIAMDVEKRVAEHNGKGRLGARYTRARRPVKLVYREPASNRSAAAKREYAIKQMRRGEKMELIGAVRNKRRTSPVRHRRGGHSLP